MVYKVIRMEDQKHSLENKPYWLSKHEDTDSIKPGNHEYLGFIMGRLSSFINLRFVKESDCLIEAVDKRKYKEYSKRIFRK